MKNSRSAKRGRSYWEIHAEAYKESGLTQREYCRQNDISYWSFNQWKRRLENEGKKLCEISSEVVQELAVGKKQIEIIIDKRLMIAIPDKFSKETLRDVLNVLEVL